MGLVSLLGAFAAGLRFERVPEAVRAKLRHHLLDSLGFICAELSAPESGAMRRFEEARPGFAEAVVIGGGARVPAADAAFVNAFHGRIDAARVRWGRVRFSANVDLTCPDLLPPSIGFLAKHFIESLRRGRQVRFLS